jgi:hypothetical protein
MQAVCFLTAPAVKCVAHLTGTCSSFAAREPVARGSRVRTVGARDCCAESGMKPRRHLGRARATRDADSMYRDNMLWPMGLTKDLRRPIIVVFRFVLDL